MRNMLEGQTLKSTGIPGHQFSPLCSSVPKYSASTGTRHKSIEQSPFMCLRRSPSCSSISQVFLYVSMILAKSRLGVDIV